MTREEAIKILSKDTSMETVNGLIYYAGFNKEKVVEKIQEAMEMGAKALEKQIPKKQIKSENQMFFDYACPFCKEDFDADTAYYLEHGEYIFCPKCGQKIDWSESDE